jgi:hypothetical protein
MFQTLAMPVKRFDSASLLSSDSTAIAGFATSTGAPPSTATNSPAVDTCQSAAHEAIGATEDACGQLDALYDGTFDNLDPELLATAACKSASAAAVTAIVNTCGQALGVDVSGKSATELTAADFPQNQAGFNTGRSEAASITLCAQVRYISSDAFAFGSCCLIT